MLLSRKHLPSSVGKLPLLSCSRGRTASVRRSYKLRENAGGARNSMVKKTQCISSQSITHYDCRKSWPSLIRVPSVPIRYADDDEYALSLLPQQEQKKAWTEHHACAFLEFVSDPSSKSRIVPDAEAYASLAKLALQLGDPNCTAIFVPVKNIMMPK